MSSRRFFSRNDNHRAPRSRGVFSTNQQNRHLSNGRNYGRNRNDNSQPASNIYSNGPNLGSNWNKPNHANVNNAPSGSSASSGDLLPLNELPAKEKLLVPEILDQEESKVVEKTIDAFKSRGHFDEFRKDILDAFERLPNYRNLKYKVMSCVSKFTARQGPFHMGLKKNLMRDRLRDELMKDSNGFSNWINDLVDELIGANIERKIRSVVQTTLEDFIPDEEPPGVALNFQFDQQIPVPNSTANANDVSGRPERLPTPPPLVKHYSEELALAKLDSDRLEALRKSEEMAGNNGADTKQDSDLDDAGSPVAPRLIEEEDEDASDSGRPKSGGQTAPQLLFNQLAHFSMYPEDAPPELREALMANPNVSSAPEPTSGADARHRSSVMVDESPTGVEDIISPEMMDIEDGDSPGPIHQNETWSTEETSTAEEPFLATSAGSNSDNSHTEPGATSSVLNEDPSDPNSVMTSYQGGANSASSPITAVAAARSTLGSLLMEKKRLKTEKIILPAPKASNSDMESISSESDFDSTSSSSDEQTVPSIGGSPAKSSPNKIQSKASSVRRHSSSSDDVPIGAVPSETLPAVSRVNTTSTHVTRSGRMGKQPRRYSPDSAENFRSPSSSANRHEHIKKQSKSTPKRFYPGNSPSMLLKPKRDRTPTQSPDDISAERRKTRPVSSPEPKPANTSARSAIQKVKKEVRDKRSPMPKVHLSSRTYRDPKSQDGYSSQDSGRHSSSYRSNDKSSSKRERSKARSPMEVNLESSAKSPKFSTNNETTLDQDMPDLVRPETALDNSNSSSINTTTSNNTSTSESEMRNVSEERHSRKTSESISILHLSGEKMIEKSIKKEDKENDLKFEATEYKENSDTSKSAAKDFYIDTKTSKMSSEAKPRDLNEAKEKVLDNVEPKETRKKEIVEKKPKSVEDDVEEGEITDSDSSSGKPPSPEPVKKPRIESPRPRQQTVLKEVRLSSLVEAPEVERPPAPPSPPPLKRMRKKHKASSKKWSESSSSEDSDDSLIERLNKKDKANRQRMESSVIDVSLVDRMRTQKLRSTDTMRREEISVKNTRRPRESSQMPQGQIMADSHAMKVGRVVKNKDSWLEKERHQNSLHHRGRYGREEYASHGYRYRRYGRRSPNRRSRSKSLDRKSRSRGPYQEIGISTYQCKSNHRKAVSPSVAIVKASRSVYEKSRCESTEKPSSSSSLAPSAICSTSTCFSRALSPEFHQKGGELSPPPFVDDKNRKRPRMEPVTEHIPREEAYTKFRHASLKSGSLGNNIKRVPSPPPPIAASGDNSSDSDSNASSTSENSSASSSSSADERDGSIYVSASDRKHEKLRGYSLAHSGRKFDESGTSVYSKHHKKRYKRPDGSLSSRQNESRSMVRSSSKQPTNSTEDEEYDDDKKSADISSDEILVSTSHISPRGR